MAAEGGVLMDGKLMAGKEVEVTMAAQEDPV